MKRLGVGIVMVVALVSAACSAASVPSGSVASPMSPAPASTPLATGGATAPSATSGPTPTPDVAVRILDTPSTYTRSSADAVDGTTAVGWVKVGRLDDELPAVWDTTTGELRVLDVPDEFVHANGETYVRLTGVSGTTAVGTGVLGRGGKRGQDRAMAWDTVTGDLRILDIPDGFTSEYTRTEAHAVSGTTAVGEVWARHGEIGAAVAWDTETGEARILEMPADHGIGSPSAISGDTVVGTWTTTSDDALPLIWDPLGSDARDLDLLPSTRDGVPVAVDGTTVVGRCCFGEEGTPLPLIWDAATGAVGRLAIPGPDVYATAIGVSGSIAIGHAESADLVWDLATGDARVLAPPVGFERFGMRAVSGRTIVGSACPPPPSSTENPRCVAAAWTLP